MDMQKGSVEHQLYLQQSSQNSVVNSYNTLVEIQNSGNPLTKGELIKLADKRECYSWLKKLIEVSYSNFGDSEFILVGNK